MYYSHHFLLVHPKGYMNKGKAVACLFHPSLFCAPLFRTLLL